MKTSTGLAFAVLLTLTATTAAHSADTPIAVVAAENFYGDVAKQIGGDQVAVVSVMSNPDQDPHLFETTPSTVRGITGAQIVIFNGADYDPWMPKLLNAAPQARPRRHRRRNARRQEGGRQSASLVRPADHAGRRQGARRRIQCRRSRAQGRLRSATEDIRRLAQADERQDRRHSRQICRRAGDGERAGVRLHGRRARE